jgi:malonyl-CoA O-methyltransferase
VPDATPPTLDPLAAARWQARLPERAPWLHEEVARRMADRLEWIRLVPGHWVHWSPLRGGLEAQSLIEQRYPEAGCTLVEPQAGGVQAARSALAAPWWRRWGSAARRRFACEPAGGQAQMLWANMALHFESHPQARMAQWHAALATDGFLMFSCFGPDTARELHAVYADLGWGPAGPAFTDMHDWGDMLVASGFAEPVMDMERITLTWESPQRLLAELRELGANLHPHRFPGLRGRGWRRRLETELAARLAGPDGRLALTFEIVYGHALRPAPRLRMGGETTVSVDDLRSLLQAGRKGSK